MLSPVDSEQRPSWNEPRDDHELQNVGTSEQQEGSIAGGAKLIGNHPTALPDPTRTRKILLVIGLVLATLDLCIMPIVYFYSLTYASTLTSQYVLIVITCLFCMMTFAHYTHRCCRLLFKCSSRYGPIGWSRKYRLLEFTNVNCAICATIFEVVLAIGTAPEYPYIRLCAMPSSIICYYFGILFLLTAFLTQYRYRLPFDMSSTQRGSLWRPALVAILEDCGSIEGRCEVAYRQAVMTRYESSPLFRQMLLRVTWMWGFGFVAIAIVSTILIFVLPENIAFGVGWGLPYVWAAIYSLVTVAFVKRSLREERKAWGVKGAMF